jgi:hypothetical protein
MAAEALPQALREATQGAKRADEVATIKVVSCGSRQSHPAQHFAARLPDLVQTAGRTPTPGDLETRFAA